MKLLVIGAHLRRDDVAPLAEPVPCCGLWLSGVSIAHDQPLSDRELLLRVAETRARLLDRATFIAIRYGFTIRNAAEAESKCAEHAEGWRRTLEANHECVEMTLKVAAASPKPRPDRHDFAKGADYLRALHDAAHAADVDPAFRDAVSRLGTHRWEHRDSRSLECALLVKRDDVARIREAGEQLKKDFPGVAFLLSGPWPLEMFADADHE